jgi:peptide/nickel transport system substrate-binding protein
MLNPFVNSQSVDYNVRSLVYESLLGVDHNLNLLPVLAERYTVNKDGSEYTFHLRKGVRFHSGQEMTAEDVKWSIDYIREPKNSAFIYSSFLDVKSIEVIDSHTIRFKLDGPFAPFPEAVTSTTTPILPKGSLGIAEKPQSFPPGTGPFRFVEWKPGAHLILAKFPQYWKPGIPYLDRIVMKPIPDETVRVTALRSAQFDLVEEVPLRVVDQIQKGMIKDVSVVPASAAAFRRITFNCAEPPFKDVRVRQAVAFAVNKKEIVDGMGMGYGEVANHRYPKSSRWYVPLEERPYNPEKARALLAEAGYPNGLQVPMNITSGDLEEALVVQAQLRKVGIDIKMEVVNFGEFMRKESGGTFRVSYTGAGIRPDPDSLLYHYYHTKEIGKRNHAHYSNPQFDRLLERARETLVFDERKKLYGQALEIFQQDVPNIFVAFFPRFYGFRPQVKGFSTTIKQDFAFANGGMPWTWIEKTP